MDSLQIRRIEFPGNRAWKETQCSLMFIDYWTLSEDVTLCLSFYSSFYFLNDYVLVTPHRIYSLYVLSLFQICVVYYNMDNTAHVSPSLSNLHSPLSF